MASARKKPQRKPAARPSRGAGRSGGRSGRTSSGADGSFPRAFAALLRSRGLAVPRGLAAAPPEAYAGQPASFVEQLSSLPDAELKRFADKVGGYARRAQERAEAEWERSPLIAELRRRRLKEPPRPTRATGVSVSLAKPLTEWSDAEILRAATEWSRRGA